MNRKVWAERIIFVLGVASLLLLVSCGSYMAPAMAPAEVSIAIIPSAITVPQGAAESFFARITGSSNLAVIWSVQEGGAGGSVTSSGIYTAPNLPGTYHVIATSQADSTAQAMAVITVPQLSLSVSPATANLAQVRHSDAIFDYFRA